MSSTNVIRQIARRSAAVASSSMKTASTRIVASRGLQTRLYSSTMHENDPVVLEREKHRNLHGKHNHGSTVHPEHAPGWNEELASESEAVVKAAQSSSADPAKLVEETVKRVKSKHHGEEVPIVQIKAETEQLLTADNGEVAEAKYEKDEVTGPLKEAVSKVADVLTGNGKKN
ncbi:hypothetical protein SCHPADRAFT_937099 [Schizopora paradoxa]|uniref:Uncharacterized protein n=1 Tax=Schizopora paradoxa TaxID=27342 RepID=A0A0H2RZA5_9AGAM|nr:hypothetical protein SCHPADRAFT_937099 [Schizopora paradoxa]